MLLALDLATRTGWAFGRAGEKPTYGVLDLPAGASKVVKCDHLRRFLEKRIADGAIALVREEAPNWGWGKRANTNRRTIELLQALATTADVVARAARLRVLPPVPISSLKLFWTGYAKHHGSKQPMIWAAQQRVSQDITDDNIADALALWHWGENEIWPKHGSARALDGMLPPAQQPDAPAGDRLSVDAYRSFVSQQRGEKS